MASPEGSPRSREAREARKELLSARAKKVLSGLGVTTAIVAGLWGGIDAASISDDVEQSVIAAGHAEPTPTELNHARELRQGVEEQISNLIDSNYIEKFRKYSNSPQALNPLHQAGAISEREEAYRHARAKSWKDQTSRIWRNSLLGTLGFAGLGVTAIKIRETVVQRKNSTS